MLQVGTLTTQKGCRQVVASLVQRTFSKLPTALFRTLFGVRVDSAIWIMLFSIGQENGG